MCPVSEVPSVPAGAPDQHYGWLSSDKPLTFMAIWWGDEEVLALYPHFPLLSSGFDRPPPRTQFLFDVLWRRKVVSAPGGSFFNHPPWLGRLPEALAPHIWLPFHYTHRELTCVFSGLLDLFMSGPSSLSLS